MKTIENLDEETLLVTDGELKYVQFKSLLQYGERLKHCFTTRIGGVSTGECSTLNLGFRRNDSAENVAENFKRLCRALDIDTGSLVFSNQVHESKVEIVRTGDKSLGIDISGNSIKDKVSGRLNQAVGVDGLATCDKGITLVTFYADCVPVLLYERNGKATASVHSGWRSTLKGITCEAVRVLENEAAADPAELICVIGPSIGKCCFEVDRDVYDEFRALYREDKHYTALDNGKWKIDLRGIIKQDAIKAGIPENNIHTSTICTKCRNDLFYSYRGDGGKTGSLAVFMQLKEI